MPKCLNPIPVLWEPNKKQPTFMSMSNVNNAYEMKRFNTKSSKGIMGLLPCGKCESCKLNRSKEWANRIQKETKYHKECWFFTMTYNEENIKYAANDKGVWATLVKRDVQLFWKRMRKAYKGQPKKYYVAGEYGPKTSRPHYHAIIFGLEINDLKICKISQGNKLGDTYWSSEKIDKIWGMGNVIIAKATYETANYVARYTTKKQYNKEDKNVPYEKEFLNMSKGIGKQYYIEHKKQIYKTDEFINATQKGILKSKPPRYYDKMLEKEEPEKLEKIKKKRKLGQYLTMKQSLKQSNYKYQDMLKGERLEIINKLKKIKKREI